MKKTLLKPLKNSSSQNLKTAPRWYESILMTVATVISSLTFSTGVTFAAEDIFGKIEGILGDFYSKFFMIATVLAVLMLTINFLAMFFQDEQDARGTKKRAIRIVVCYIAILCLGGIIAFLQSTFTGLSYTTT